MFSNSTTKPGNLLNSPANTGKDNNNKKEVIKIDHTNNGVSFQVIPGVLILNIVVISVSNHKSQIHISIKKCRPGTKTKN